MSSVALLNGSSRSDGVSDGDFVQVFLGTSVGDNGVNPVGEKDTPNSCYPDSSLSFWIKAVTHSNTLSS